MATSPCYGIDLGTTCSAIAIVQNGTPRILAVDGQELLPSVVMYPREGEVLVGQPALNALPLDPERAVLSSKRFMGTDHRYTIGDSTVSPVDVAARVLSRLAEAVLSSTGVRPQRVVITVPAWFTQAQRSDTRKAGELAGFEVERIINEPTAAALAHAHGQDVRRRVLVYDLGGGTFDVSLVEQDGPVVEVKASHGDSRLGGDDIDLALVDLVLRRLAETDSELRDAVDRSIPARVRLRLAVEQAKVELSELPTTTLRVPFLLSVEGKDRHLDMELSREDVEDASEPFLQRTIRSVDQVFADTGLKARQIDELLLVGGSTLQPRVWHLLHERYGLEGSHAISPRRAVVLGAAIQAAIVDGSRTDGILVDVAPYSLSVGVTTGFGGMTTHYVCKVITPRNTPLPARHTEVFYTAYPNQPGVQIPVFQGSHSDPRRNTILGMVRMMDLAPAPAGSHERPIRVQFRHDLDGLVDIEVTDALSGRSVRGQVAADGAEQEDLRAAMAADWAEHGLILGDGSDPAEEDEVFELQEGGSGAPAAEQQASPDAEEARACFAAVLAASARLVAEHPAMAPRLIALAEAGRDADAAGDNESVMQRYDELSDELFSLGVYL